MKLGYLWILAVIGAIGMLLLLTDVIVRDQALALAASGLLACAVAVGVGVMPAAQTQSDDAWSRIAWGKFFVAIVYASVAIACFVAMAHTPDAVRFAHAMRAVL